MTDPYMREYEERRRQNRNELMREAYIDGWTIKRIAAEFGVSKTTAYKVCEDVESPEQTRNRREVDRQFDRLRETLPPETMARIEEVLELPLYANGYPDRLRVYFIQEVPDGYVKIGSTYNPAGERLKQLQCGNPRTLVLRRVVQGVTEAEMHKHFAHLRVRGEWFRVDDELEKFMSSDASGILDKSADLEDPQ